MSLFDDDFFSRPFSLLEPFVGGFGSRMLTEFPEPGQPVQVDGPVQTAEQSGPCGQGPAGGACAPSASATPYRSS